MANAIHLYGCGDEQVLLIDSQYRDNITVYFSSYNGSSYGSSISSVNNSDLTSSGYKTVYNYTDGVADIEFTVSKEQIRIKTLGESVHKGGRIVISYGNTSTGVVDICDVYIHRVTGIKLYIQDVTAIKKDATSYFVTEYGFDSSNNCLISRKTDEGNNYTDGLYQFCIGPNNGYTVTAELVVSESSSINKNDTRCKTRFASYFSTAEASKYIGCTYKTTETNFNNEAYIPIGSLHTTSTPTLSEVSKTGFFDLYIGFNCTPIITNGVGYRTNNQSIVGDLIRFRIGIKLYETIQYNSVDELLGGAGPFSVFYKSSNPDYENVVTNIPKSANHTVLDISSDLKSIVSSSQVTVQYSATSTKHQIKRSVTTTFNGWKWGNTNVSVGGVLSNIQQNIALNAVFTTGETQYEPASITLDAVPSKSGYTVVGWATSEGGAKKYNSGASVSSSEFTQTTILYPVYKADAKYAYISTSSNGSEIAKSHNVSDGDEFYLVTNSTSPINVTTSNNGVGGVVSSETEPLSSGGKITKINWTSATAGEVVISFTFEGTEKQYLLKKSVVSSYGYRIVNGDNLIVRLVEKNTGSIISSGYTDNIKLYDLKGKTIKVKDMDGFDIVSVGTLSATVQKYATYSDGTKQDIGDTLTANVGITMSNITGWTSSCNVSNGTGSISIKDETAGSNQATFNICPYVTINSSVEYIGPVSLTVSTETTPSDWYFVRTFNESTIKGCISQFAYSNGNGWKFEGYPSFNDPLLPCVKKYTIAYYNGTTKTSDKDIYIMYASNDYNMHQTGWGVGVSYAEDPLIIAVDKCTLSVWALTLPVNMYKNEQTSTYRIDHITDRVLNGEISLVINRTKTKSDYPVYII